MKHSWEPAGLREKLYCEAQCSKCNKLEASGADFRDADKILKFWDEIELRSDCKGFKPCSWRFKSPKCGYVGQESSCDKMLYRCRQLNNSPRFGGFPGTGG